MTHKYGYEPGQTIKGINANKEEEVIVITDRPITKEAIEFFIISPSVINPHIPRIMPIHALSSYIKTCLDTDYYALGAVRVKNSTESYQLEYIGA